MSEKTGWEKDRRSHFGQIAQLYDRIRPEYPPALFQDILHRGEQAQGKRAVEIGAGTGKATAKFLNAGYDVTAVELSGEMCRFLRERFPDAPRLNIVTASFEDAALPADRWDLVYAASAFHWVDAKIGGPKTYRLLRRGGTLALFRYNMIADEGGETYEAIQKVMDREFYSYYTAQRRPVRKTHEELRTPSEIFAGFGFRDLREYGFRDIETRFYDADMIYTADEYLALLDTMADFRALPDANRTRLYEGIRRAILAHGDAHRITYTFRLLLGRK